MRTVNVRARAKINLFLRITGRRDDGYHTLETIFQSVCLCDDIAIFTGGGGGIEISTNKRFLPADARNIAYRAAQMFFECTGLQNPGLRIAIKKRIPVGGGMGGGSADASAVLHALNSAFGRPLGMARLLELGLSLGADVPFCLTLGAAHARGVGEELAKIQPLPHCHIVGCRPGISVSTKAAFELFDAYGGKTAPRESGGMLSALARGDLAGICAGLHNDFEQPLMNRWPELRRAKERMLALGAMGALMTGSGSVVYGIFGREPQARAAAAALSRGYGDVFVTSPYIPAGNGAQASDGKLL